MKTKLIEIISNQQYVCTTSDVWSSRAQSFFGMTIHFLNTEFKRESFVLGFRQLKYKQTNKELAEIILKIYADFNISTSKVTHMVTDGGSAFCKAFKIYGTGVDSLVERPAILHDNNGGTNNDNDDGDVAEDVPFMQYDDGEQFYSNILNFNAEDDNEPNNSDDDIEPEGTDNMPDDEFFDFEDDAIMSEVPTTDSSELRNDEFASQPLPPQRRCQSHLLHLTGSDFEENLTGRAKTIFIRTLNRLQSLWVFPRRSSQAKTYSQEILGTSLLIPCPTRWNSKYDAISKVLDLGPTKIDKYIKSLKQNMKSAAHLADLEKEDWLMINVYVKVLKPIATALDRLQGEKDCSQGYILPTLFAMRHRLTELDGGTLLKSCRDTMLKAIDKRFGLFFKIADSNRDLILASVTIPKFKTNFIESNVDCLFVQRFLVEECISLQSISNSNQINERNDDEINDTEDFYVSYASNRPNRRGSIESAIEGEVSKYLADSRGDISILLEYASVMQVYFKHNTTLSASAAVERLFSQSSLIFTPRRNRLLPENFERILLMKHNQKILTN